METTMTSARTLNASSEQRPPLRDIMKILGMKEVATNVFSIPTKKKN